MAETIEMLAEAVRSAFHRAIYDRVTQLVEAGFTQHDLSMRLDRDRTLLFVCGVHDSSYWIETKGHVITVRGEPASRARPADAEA